MRPPRLPTVLFAALIVLAAADARADEDPPRITHTPVERVQRGEPLRISATMKDESEIFAPTLYFRSPGQEGYESVILHQEGDVFTAQIPLDGDVQYWIEAYDEYGNGPTRVGTPAAPHLVVVVDRPPPAPVVRLDPAPAASAAPTTVSAPDLEPDFALPDDPYLLPVEPTPVYKQWWFLTGAGVVSAAAVGAIVYALRPDDVYRNTFGATVTRP